MRRTGGAEPLPAKRKWQAIVVATAILAPAHWALLIAFVAAAADDKTGAPNATAAFALGLALVPFVFLALALLSAQVNAGGAVLKAMLLSLVVGIPAAAVAGDAVTGIVAGVGAGGIVALRADRLGAWRMRALGVLAATVYTFVLVRTTGAFALLPAPVFPLTALGLADRYADRRESRAVADPTVDPARS